MVRIRKGLVPVIVALAVLASASIAQAQVVCYQPAPVAVAPVTTYYAPPVVSYYAPAPVTTYYAPAPVTTYYAPAPVVSYYAPAPAVSYYAAAPAVTTYRYGPLGRLRSVRSYYGAPAVSYGFGYYYP
jgi:hypothetical protein